MAQLQGKVLRYFGHSPQFQFAPCSTSLMSGANWLVPVREYWVGGGLPDRRTLSE